MPLQKSSLKHGINTGITETPAMREYEACIAAGESTWRWEQKWDPEKGTGYPEWYKANILAWHMMHRLKEVHSSDVVATVQERESKKRRNK